MKQKDYVIDAMRKNGGYATLRQLNYLVDVSSWGTKTPFASIRRIVQVNDEFFKIQPGLWALKECEQDVLKKFNIVQSSKSSVDAFTHSYYQGIIAEIGNIRNRDTYVPPQDKNKLFLEGLVLPSVDHLYVLSKLLKVHIEDLLVSGDEELNYIVADTKQGRTKERLYEYWTRIQAKQCA